MSKTISTGICEGVLKNWHGSCLALARSRARAPHHISTTLPCKRKEIDAGQFLKQCRLAKRRGGNYLRRVRGARVQNHTGEMLNEPMLFAKIKSSITQGISVDDPLGSPRGALTGPVPAAGQDLRARELRRRR